MQNNLTTTREDLESVRQDVWNVQYDASHGLMRPEPRVRKMAKSARSALAKIDAILAATKGTRG